MPTPVPPVPTLVSRADLDDVFASAPYSAIVVQVLCHPASPVVVTYHGDGTLVLRCATCDQGALMLAMDTTGAGAVPP